MCCPLLALKRTTETRSSLMKLVTAFALKQCQIRLQLKNTTLFLNVSPHDRLCFPQFMQGDVSMLIICNYFQLFECITAANAYFPIKLMYFILYFTIALFSLYLAHLNTFIYLQYIN